MTNEEKSLLVGCTVWCFGFLGAIVAIAAAMALAYRAFRFIAGV